MVHQLKDKVDKSREEMEQLQGEIKFFEEAVFVKSEQASGMEAGNEPLSVGSSKTSCKLQFDEVYLYINCTLIPLFYLLMTSFSK